MKTPPVYVNIFLHDGRNYSQYSMVSAWYASFAMNVTFMTKRRVFAYLINFDHSSNSAASSSFDELPVFLYIRLQ
jgi:hypothetical protein